ncbi:MAG: DUF2520 domain-containing protein, partial [Actinobacteria bacterium]
DAAGDRLLERRAVDQPGLARTPIVERDERVAREHVLHQVAVEARRQVERPGRSLARPTGDQEHRSPRRAARRQNLDVEADRSGSRAGAVERNRDCPALDAAGLARRQHDRCPGLPCGGEEPGGDQGQDETATHEARQGSSAGVPFLGPVSVPELELEEVFDTITVIGSGRVGSAVSARLREREIAVGPGGGLVLLCVPDEAIPSVARELPAGPWVAHVSGATPLAALDPHSRRFSLHPLQTFTRARGPDQLDGAWAALTAESKKAREIGAWLAATLGLRPFPLDDAARPLYHAGAAIASNYLVTLHAVASELFRAAGAPPEALVPLMRRTIENGFELTGPIERGDWETVEAHRRAIRAARPDLEPLYDVLAEATAR